MAIAADVTDGVGLRTVPPPVFSWLEAQALRLVEMGETPWLRLTQRRGRRAVQVTNFVGVLRAPDGQAWRPHWSQPENRRRD